MLILTPKDGNELKKRIRGIAIESLSKGWIFMVEFTTKEIVKKRRENVMMMPSFDVIDLQLNARLLQKFHF